MIGISLTKGGNLVPLNEPTTVIVLGTDLTNKTTVALTTYSRQFGSHCSEKNLFNVVRLNILAADQRGFVIPVILPEPSTYYVCVHHKHNNTWIHQGNEKYVSLAVQGSMMPIWLQCLLIGVLLCLSGLFAGLNLGLMKLDHQQLKELAISGTDDEKRYVSTIEPIRSKGHYLLCTILLANVMINSTTTVLMDELLTGGIAIISSTIFIVIFGDIIPQAICSKYGLLIGAKTSWITYFFMFVTFPLSYPISKILDCLLGEI